MTESDAKELLSIIARDKSLLRELGTMLAKDPGFVRQLIESLHEAHRNGSRLPS